MYWAGLRTGARHCNRKFLYGSGSNEVKSLPLGESQCGGLQEVIDPAGDQKSAPANADLDVIEVRVADNVIGGKEKISFKLRIANLSTLVPNRQWRVIWNYPVPP